MCSKFLPLLKSFFSISAKEDIVHTFTGVDWFEYSMKNNAIDSYRDQLLLSFKTNRQTGLIFHAGQPTDYMNLALVDGSIRFTIRLFDNEFEITFDNDQGSQTYADDIWHDVKIEREVWKVSPTSWNHAFHNIFPSCVGYTRVAFASGNFGRSMHFSLCSRSNYILHKTNLTHFATFYNLQAADCSK